MTLKQLHETCFFRLNDARPLRVSCALTEIRHLTVLTQGTRRGLGQYAWR